MNCMIPYNKMVEHVCTKLTTKHNSSNIFCFWILILVTRNTHYPEKKSCILINTHFARLLVVWVRIFEEVLSLFRSFRPILMFWNDFMFWMKLMCFCASLRVLIDIGVWRMRWAKDWMCSGRVKEQTRWRNEEGAKTRKGCNTRSLERS